MLVRRFPWRRRNLRSTIRDARLRVRATAAFLRRMALIVQKFGGTSVGDAERIKRVATRVAAAADAGNRVCVVVSAMGEMTDQLIDLARQVSEQPHPRE